MAICKFLPAGKNPLAINFLDTFRSRVTSPDRALKSGAIFCLNQKPRRREGRAAGQALRAARRASGRGSPLGSCRGDPRVDVRESPGEPREAAGWAARRQRSPRDARRALGTTPGVPGAALGDREDTPLQAPSAGLCSPGTGQGQQPPAPVTFRGRGRDALRGRHFPVGCAGLGMSSLPCARNKEPGRRGLRAEGIQWHLVHLSARQERLPLTFMSRAEPGQPAAAGVGGGTDWGGRAKGGCEGARPRARHAWCREPAPPPGPRGRLCPSPATHLQHPSVKSSWCLLPESG